MDLHEETLLFRKAERKMSIKKRKMILILRVRVRDEDWTICNNRRLCQNGRQMDEKAKKLRSFTSEAPTPEATIQETAKPSSDMGTFRGQYMQPI